MDMDIVFVAGLLFGVLAVPAAVAAYADERTPRAAAILVGLAAALILLAIWRNPGAYTIAGIPEVIYAVIGNFLYGNG